MKRTQALQAPSPQRWLVLIAVMLAFLPIVIDLTILHVAIPSLTLALGASGTEVLWIIDIYPLLMAGLLIPMGTLADRVGHRRMMLIGLFIFTIGSAFAAFSPTPTELIGARAFMAFGSAMVMPCTLAILRQTFDDERERALALGIWGSVGSAGAALGPLTGGALLEHFWWGSVFLVNVPLVVLILPLVAWLAPRTSPVGEGNWTIGQAAILMLGIMASVFALKSGFKPDSAAWITVAAAVTGLSMLIWFVRLQQRSSRPMLDMSLFARPAISTGVLMALVVMGSLAGVELMLAQELQFVLQHSALEAGLFMLPLMIGSAIGGPLAGVILQVTGLRLVATTSLFVAAGSLAALAHSDLAYAGIEVDLMLGALGLALGIGLTASSVAIMSSTPVEKAGSAGALEATSYDLGTGLGITGFGLLLAAGYQGAMTLPAGVSMDMAATASRSIGETLAAAQRLDGPASAALAEAGRQAFSSAYRTVLLSASGLVSLLGIGVLFALRHYHPVDADDPLLGAELDAKNEHHPQNTQLHVSSTTKDAS